ncbi:MAG TPA: hypothetical protein VNT25_00220 [Allosphingosinicella sp.]|nr:hypothetical protein [Allosphingosinicella sp.]
MRAFASLLAASFALAGAAEAAPRRVASLNLCTDELLLALGDPRQIVSVTHLAQRKEETPYWSLARRYRKNDGSLLAVAPLRPDLLLTMGGGGRDRIGIAGRLGVRVLDLPYPQNLQDIKKALGQVSAALGRPNAGRKAIAEIERLERSRPKEQRDTIWLGGGGRTVAVPSLAAEWMALAGFRQRSLGVDKVTLEQLLVSPPGILLRSDYRIGEYSGEQRWLRHPLARGTRRSRTIPTDGRAWTCMGPAMIEEVKRLRTKVHA